MTFESKLSIIIPCFNEEKNIPNVLPEIIKYGNINNIKIIVVNDGSSDNSESELKKINDSSLIVLNHKVNKGYGAAIKTGILLAETEYIITMDADGQHRLEDVTNLYNFIRKTNADMIIGSREGKKSASFIRGFGKAIIRFIASILMKLSIYDINSGMKIYRTDLAKKYISLCPDGMPYSDIIALAFVFRKHLVLEFPIEIKQRLTGKSTISAKTAFETVSAILNIVVLFNPFKIFLPLTLFFFLIGLVWGIPILIMGRGVSVGSSLLFILSVLSFLLGLIAEQLSSIRQNQIQ